MPALTPLSILSEISSRERLGDSFARTLSDAKVRSVKAGASLASVADGGGLSLFIAPSGAKVWRFRYRLDGKPQTFTIGGYPEVSLTDARTMHRAARWLVERGVHPLAHVEGDIAKAKAEEAAAALHTFTAVYGSWEKATRRGLSPRTVKHRADMIAKYILPKFNDQHIGTITRKQLRDFLKPIDDEFPVTAKHCRGYLKQIFDYAVEEEIINGNPIPSAEVLVHNASRSVVPRKALPLRRMGEFLRALDGAGETDPLTKAALRLVILTWCRTAEVIGAKWAEFDLEDAVWRIPAARMKAGEEHTVYLSSQVVALLRELRSLSGTDEFLFPSRRTTGAHMCRTTLNAWVARHEFKDVADVHGFRAVASTWANETGQFRPDVIECALAHKEQNHVRAAYNRAEYAQERRRLWQMWADKLETLETAANVIPMTRSAA